jgi:hypothetical protein
VIDGVYVWVRVLVEVLVLVGLPVWVIVLDSVLVLVAVRVLVGVLVRLVGVLVLVDVLVRVAVAVLVAVLVLVEVGVNVFEGVGVSVLVGVSVIVGVFDGVNVSVGVLVGRFIPGGGMPSTRATRNCSSKPLRSACRVMCGQMLLRIGRISGCSKVIATWTRTMPSSGFPASSAGAHRQSFAVVIGK